MGRALLPGDGGFQVPAGGPGRRRRRQQPVRHPLQLLCDGGDPRRHGRDLCPSARGGADDAARGRHRLRFLDAPAARRAGQGGRRRRVGAAVVYGCVGRDVPHHHERRLSPRRDDGDVALRPSRHRGLCRSQARARPAAHVQPVGAGDRRLYAGGRGKRAVGTGVPQRTRGDRRESPAGARVVGQDHAGDLCLCRARRDLYRPHQPPQQPLVLRDDHCYQPLPDCR